MPDDFRRWLSRWRVVDHHPSTAIASLADALVGELVLALMLRQQERERIERDRFWIETPGLLTGFRRSAVDRLQRTENVGFGRLVAIRGFVPRHTQFVDETPRVRVRHHAVVHRLHLHGLDADDALCALVVGFDAFADAR